ncbi:MAG: hypothetical protein NTZ05_01450 [Chloroflexi bacterium]|nr:hypothetical protein [Chloroflexota bacterium]
MNPVRATLIPAVMGMEAAWLFAAVGLVSTIGGMPQVALSPVVVMALFGLAWLVSWLSDQLDVPLFALRIAGAALAIIAVTVAAQIASGRSPAPWDPLWFVSPVTQGGRPGVGAQALVATIGALAVWQRGVRLALREHGFDAVLRSFRMGLAVVASEAVAEALMPPGVGAAWVVVPFFALGLLALSLSHLEEVGRAYGGAQRRWLWLPPAVIVGVATLAAALALGLYRVLWAWLLAVLSLGERAVNTVFFGFALIIGLFAECLVNGLKWLISLIGPRSGQLQPSGLSQLLNDVRQRPTVDEALFAFIAEVIKFGIMAILIVIVVLWLARALGRRQRNQTEDLTADRESLWTDRTFGDDLQAMLANLRGAFKMPRRRWADLGEDERALVLRSYLESLDQAEQRGAVRRADQTAEEFAPALAGAFPGAGPSAAELTQRSRRRRRRPAAPYEPRQNLPKPERRRRRRANRTRAEVITVS